VSLDKRLIGFQDGAAVNTPFGVSLDQIGNLNGVPNE